MNKIQLRNELNQPEGKFDQTLLDLGIDFDKEDLTPEEVAKVRSHFQSALAAAPESSDRLATDDDVLAISEATGVDLDVVMQAREQLVNLEALVRFVEVYQERKWDEQIKAAANRQWEVDELLNKQADLEGRFEAALKPREVPLDFIYQNLGIETSQKLKDLADKDKTPDFLTNARQRFTQLRR